MNILFFLLPKAKVEFIYSDYSLRQALEKMSYYHYASIPVLNKDGTYYTSISEGDILWALKEIGFNMEKAMQISIKNVSITRPIKEININKDMRDLDDLIIEQNFVPVVDDRGIFIGIVTRKSVIKFLQESKK